MSAWRVLVLAVLVAAPSVASACPACLGNPRNMGVLKMVGVLVLTPFVIVGAVIWAIRRANRDLDIDSPIR